MNNTLNTKDWQLFKMSDVYTFTKGKRLTKEDMIPGKLNYLGAISDNNAVRDYIDAEPQHKGNCITVNYNGSVGEAFYQSEPFWATDDINILDLKEKEMTENIALFLCSIIKHNKYKFGYGRKWTLEKMKETKILLPIKDNKIDYTYMENYIKNLNINHIKTKNKMKCNEFSMNNWKEVTISDVFKIYRTKNINNDVLNEDGKIPYVTRTRNNNGVEKNVAEEDYITTNGNVIIIGGESAMAFYQPYPFLTGNNITVIENEHLNKYNALFITTLINKENYKYSYGRAFNTKNIINTKIPLPFRNNNIDWGYMENYIKSLPYADKM